MHSTPIQIRFNDLDIIGHVNNNVYLQYMDLGKMAYFEATNPETVDWRHVNVAVVNINCDFKAQTRITEPIEVRTRTLSIGESSLTLEQQVVNSKTGEVKCEARTVMVSFDPKAGVSTPIDPKWIAALNEYEGRELRKKPE
ncbi:MAG: acyl-CoA thioesterase [Muribaculaceae bacterium]|nr:acyl-CoA thioesterase [Muribaculaceae bacterium]